MITELGHKGRGGRFSKMEQRQNERKRQPVVPKRPFEGNVIKM